MNLTKNEKLMIENIISNEYDEGLNTVVWVSAVQYSHNEFPMESYKGILGSLIKKKLVKITEENENVVTLTESGKKIALQLFGEKYD
jgi:predicted methyltransferase